MRIDVSQNDRPSTSRHGAQRPAGSADVKERHGDQTDRVFGDVEGHAGLADGGRQVGIGQHDPLRQPGRPGRVQLHAHFTRSTHVSGIFGGNAIKPRAEGHGPCIRAHHRVGADDHDPTDRGQAARHIGQKREVVGMDRQQRGARIVDDGGHFRWGQSPVDRDVHRTHERASEQEIEVRDAVPVQEGDPVAGAQAIASSPLAPHGTPCRTPRTQLRRSAPSTSISSFPRW